MPSIMYATNCSKLVYTYVKFFIEGRSSPTSPKSKPSRRTPKQKPRKAPASDKADEHHDDPNAQDNGDENGQPERHITPDDDGLFYLLITFYCMNATFIPHKCMV